MVELTYPIALRFAYIHSCPAGLAFHQHIDDAEQVANDAVAKLILVYVRDAEFDVHSSGHLLGLLHRIVINERKQIFRNRNRRKRTPNEGDGKFPTILSLHSLHENSCLSRTADPSSQCEFNDQVEYCLRFLSNAMSSQVFLMSVSRFAHHEMAAALSVDRATIRRWIKQMRRILAPRTSHLKPASDP